ncbi:MAG: cation:proton antiporter [Dehalococcoidia bacterium]
MPDSHLLHDLAIALTVAFAGGFAARIARLPTILGYILAGVVLSPYTPGYVADLETLRSLADLGVIFLMFGVGLHFNLRDLAAVRGIAVLGGSAQIAVTAGVGYLVATLLGLGAIESLLLGLSVCIGSTVVAIRALEDRGAADSVHGRVTIGWLIVQDIATVFFLVLIPSFDAGEGNHALVDTARSLAIAAIFVATMLIAGARLVPLLLAQVARSGSRELFILTIIALALGIATGAEVFGLSVALGAFVAGVVVSETETSHQAAADVLPFREAFAVLFFVSVGMLLDPTTLGDDLALLAATLVVALLAKSLITFFVAAAFPYPVRTGLVVAAALAQVGEFSFIVAQEGLDRELLSQSTYNVILATSVMTIALNPLAFRAVAPLERQLRRTPSLWRRLDHQGVLPSTAPQLTDHVVIAGYGRVGELTGRSLQGLGIPFVVIDAGIERVRALRAQGIHAVWGDAAQADVLDTAGVTHARLLAVCVPDDSTALLAITNAHRLNPGLTTVSRAHSNAVLDLQRSLGAREVVVPEFEGGIEMIHRTLLLLGFGAAEVEAHTAEVRTLRYAAEADTPFET